MSGRQCSICNHPRKTEIEGAALAPEPESRRAIARRFGVGKDALQRHLTACISRHIATASAETRHALSVTEGETLLARLEGLVSATEGLFAEAESSGEIRTALAAIESLRRTLELVARLSGELGGGGPSSAMQFVTSPEWLLIENAISHALELYPEARSAVRRELEAAVAGHRAGAVAIAAGTRYQTEGAT